MRQKWNTGASKRDLEKFIFFLLFSFIHYFRRRPTQKILPFISLSFYKHLFVKLPTFPCTKYILFYYFSFNFTFLNFFKVWCWFLLRFNLQSKYSKWKECNFFVFIHSSGVFSCLSCDVTFISTLVFNKLINDL